MDRTGDKRTTKKGLGQRLSGPAARPRCVLLVDDNHVVTELFQHALERFYVGERVAVHTARGALEGLQLFERAGADLVVVDYFLPGGSGAALVARLRAQPHGARLPIIGTARASDDAERRMREAGVDRFLRKPVLHEALELALLDLLPSLSPLAGVGDAG